MSNQDIPQPCRTCPSLWADRCAEFMPKLDACFDRKSETERINNYISTVQKLLADAEEAELSIGDEFTTGLQATGDQVKQPMFDAIREAKKYADSIDQRAQDYSDARDELSAKFDACKGLVRGLIKITGRCPNEKAMRQFMTDQTASHTSLLDAADEYASGISRSLDMNQVPPRDISE